MNRRSVSDLTIRVSRGSLSAAANASADSRVGNGPNLVIRRYNSIKYGRWKVPVNVGLGPGSELRVLASPGLAAILEAPPFASLRRS